MEDTEVQFRENLRGIVSSLDVITPGRRSMLEPVRSVLFGLRVQIVRVESLVQENRMFERFQVVEFDGAAIGKRRGAAICAAVRLATSGVSAPARVA